GRVGRGRQDGAESGGGGREVDAAGVAGGGVAKVVLENGRDGVEIAGMETADGHAHASVGGGAGQDEGVLPARQRRIGRVGGRDLFDAGCAQNHAHGEAAHAVIGGRERVIGR